MSPRQHMPVLDYAGISRGFALLRWIRHPDIDGQRDYRQTHETVLIPVSLIRVCDSLK